MKTLRFWGFCAGFLLMTLRSWERILYPNLMSEEGKVFLPDAYEHGIKSLFEPYAGYYHTLPRLLALLVAKLDALAWAPQLFFFACALVFVWGASLILSPKYSALFKSAESRVIAFIGVLFMGGLYEGFGNPTNIHWFLTFFLGLIGLRKIRENLSLGDWALALLALSSGGESAALLPLFLVRIAFHLKEGFQKSKNSKVFRHDIALIALICVFVVLNMNARSSLAEVTGTFEKAPYLKLVSGSLYLWNNYYILQPLLGDHLTFYIARYADALYWILVAGLSFGLARIFYSKCKHERSAVLLLSAIVCFFMIPVMSWMVRPEALGIFNQIARPIGLSHLRYGAMVSGIAFLMWLYGAQSFKSPWFQRSYLVLFLALGSHRFFIGAHEPKHPTWDESLKAAQSTPCNQRGLVAIRPEGWNLHLNAKHLNPSCK